MTILGMDTSTSAIAVALADISEDPTDSRLSGLVRRTRIDPMGHSEHLAPLIAEALQEKGITPRDLTTIVVGNGPGPFTGLRVGIVTALTMGHALGIPVVGLCSLDILATQAAMPEGEDVLVATDARRKEVYWARYSGGSPSPIRRTDPTVSRPADLPEEVRGLSTVGRGSLLYPDLLPHRRVVGSPGRDGGPNPGPAPGDRGDAGAGGAVLDVDAGVLLSVAAERLAAGQPLPVEPLYLRRPDALTTAERAAQ